MKRDAYSLQQVTDTLFKKPPVQKTAMGRFGQMRLIISAVAAGAVVVGGFLALPDPAPDVAITAEPDLPPATAMAPVALLRPTPSEVTRSETVLLDLPPVQQFAGIELSNDPISHQLRQPVRLSDRSGYAYNLNALVTGTLTDLGASEPETSALRALLVQSLAQGLSDDAISLAVDAALSRGEFAAPAALRRVDGGLDTAALLTAMVAKRLGKPVQVTTQWSAHGTHVLDAGDSLAGLALKYYGQPTRFDAIAQRNAKALAGAGGLVLGAGLVIPAL